MNPIRKSYYGGPEMEILTLVRERLRSSMLGEYLVGNVKYRRNSFSQFGEDVHLRGIYDRLRYETGLEVERGWMVDVGAFRPIVYSNTYSFFRSGWSCINIDPSPGSMRLFEKVRRRDANLEMAVAPSDGATQFFCFGRPSVWNTMSEEAATLAQAQTGIEPDLIGVECATLSTILDRHLPSADLFEILLVDAEGLDYEILSSNDFERYRPRLIVVEVNRIKIEEVTRLDVYSFLVSKGYRLFSWINPNLVFVRGDCAIS